MIVDGARAAIIDILYNTKIKYQFNFLQVE